MLPIQEGRIGGGGVALLTCPILNRKGQFTTGGCELARLWAAACRIVITIHTNAMDSNIHTSRRHLNSKNKWLWIGLSFRRRGVLRVQKNEGPHQRISFFSIFILSPRYDVRMLFISAPSIVQSTNFHVS